MLLGEMQRHGPASMPSVEGSDQPTSKASSNIAEYTCVSYLILMNYFSPYTFPGFLLFQRKTRVTLAVFHVHLHNSTVLRERDRKRGRRDA